MNGARLLIPAALVVAIVLVQAVAVTLAVVAWAVAP
jgi:hypothetical protein